MAESLYSVHPSVQYVQSCIAAFERRTNKSMSDWVRLAADGPSNEEERRKWLKETHKLGSNYAWWIAERSLGKGEDDADPDAYLRAAPGYVESMYEGAKSGLRPIHDRLVELAQKLGPDVKICPCKTIVPLYRKHVFAQIKPATNMRIDLGYSLRGLQPSGRLLSTGGDAKGDRITHRIPISSVDEIDQDIERWLRSAYERDA